MPFGSGLFCTDPKMLMPFAPAFFVRTLAMERLEMMNVPTFETARITVSTFAAAIRSSQQYDWRGDTESPIRHSHIAAYPPINKSGVNSNAATIPRLVLQAARKTLIQLRAYECVAAPRLRSTWLYPRGGIIFRQSPSTLHSPLRWLGPRG
ncbi:MAG: hypothetical protein ACI9HK_005661 [Pirellulaceae bacterium]|jgi:hypothetical protein